MLIFIDSPTVKNKNEFFESRHQKKGIYNNNKMLILNKKIVYRYES